MSQPKKADPAFTAHLFWLSLVGVLVFGILAARDASLLFMALGLLSALACGFCASVTLFEGTIGRALEYLEEREGLYDPRKREWLLRASPLPPEAPERSAPPHLLDPRLDFAAAAFLLLLCCGLAYLITYEQLDFTLRLLLAICVATMSAFSGQFLGLGIWNLRAKKRFARLEGLIRERRERQTNDCG